MAENRRVTSFRLPPDILECIRRAAEIQNRTGTWVVERAVEEYCAKLGIETPALRVKRRPGKGLAA